MKVRILVAWLGEPGTVVEMPEADALGHIQDGEVEAIGEPPARARRRATAEERETR
jgi:hypothetical protein